MKRIAHHTSIKRVSVSSSAITGIGYDAATYTLRVWFITGKVYDYRRVPHKVFTGLQQAASVGAYFNRRVKPLYRYSRVV